MITFISSKCPDCGANISADPGRQFVFCSYCGAKIIINNENNYTVRHIDEARMRELDMIERDKAEAAKQEQLSRERDAEIERIASAKKRKKKVLLVCLFIFGLLFAIIGESADESAVLMIGGVAILASVSFFIKDRDDEKRKAGMIKFRYNTSTNAHTLHAQLEQAGFINVRMVNLGDIVFGIVKKPGEIESVSVNGESTNLSKWLYPDAAIIIEYHGRPRE